MAAPNNLTLDLILEYITHGHGFSKHVEGLGEADRTMQSVNAFTATRSNRYNSILPQGLGPSLQITTPDDLQAYARSMLEDPHTKGFIKTDSGGDFIHLYNSRDNTYMILNPLDRDMGTINRYPNSSDNFAKSLSDAQHLPGTTVKTFNNATTPGQVLTEVQGFARTTASRSHVPALAQAPGVHANSLDQYRGTQNLTLNGVTDSFTNTALLRSSGVEDGIGFVTAIDGSGRPSQMFLLDETTNIVTEINGRNITIHTFDNIADGDRATAARQFFDSKNIHGLDAVDGGLHGLSRSFQNNTPDVFLRQISDLTGVSKPGIPLIGNGPQRIVSAMKQGDITIATQVGYNSVGDAARAMIGFSDASTALAFDRIPADLDAARLVDLNLSPDVTRAITELSEFKSVAIMEQGADAAGYLKEFDQIFSGLNDATRSGVMDALNAVSRSPAIDMTRGAAAALDTLDAASDLASLAKAARAGRFGLNMSKAGIITAVVTTTLAVGATAYANGMVLDIADQLHASGHLTDEAYADYKVMMDSTAPMLTAQAADPTPLAIPGMFIVERIAYNDYQEFSAKHQLPENIHAMLSPSIASGTSLRGEIGNETFRIIPTETAGQPDALHTLIEARHAVDVAKQAYYDRVEEHQPQSEIARAFLNTPMIGMGGATSFGGSFSGGTFRTTSELVARAAPEVQQADATLIAARQNFQTEFDKALGDPESARALGGLLSADQLYDIVTATAQFNADTQSPLIQQYLHAQGVENSILDVVGLGDASYAQSDAEDALKANPDVMRDYLAEIFTHGVPPVLEQELAATTAPNESSIENDGHVPVLLLENDALDACTPEDAQCEYVEDSSGFVMAASAFERMATGEDLDPTEIAEVQKLMESTTAEDIAVIDALQERYPDQTTQFTQSTPEDNTCDISTQPTITYDTNAGTCAPR